MAVSALRFRIGCWIAVTAVAALMVVGSPSTAQAIDSDADGTVQWIVPFREGGGTDRWIRFIAPYFHQEFPGRPRVDIRNIPGGSSTKGANYFAGRAASDGGMALAVSASTQLAYLLGDPRVAYEYDDWVPVFASGLGGVVYVDPNVSQSGVEGTSLTFAAQGSSSIGMFIILSLERLGYVVDPVFGMKGRSAARLAFERGEVSSDFQVAPAYIHYSARLVEAGRAVPLMTLGWMDDAGNMIRDPNFPEIPHFAELYKRLHGEAPDGEWWEVWRALFSLTFLNQKMLVLPEDTDPQTLQLYLDAFARMKSRDDFQDAGVRALGRYPMADGKQLQSFFNRAVTMEPIVRDWMRRWLDERFDLQF